MARLVRVLHHMVGLALNQGLMVDQLVLRTVKLVHIIVTMVDIIKEHFDIITIVEYINWDRLSRRYIPIFEPFIEWNSQVKVQPRI